MPLDGGDIVLPIKLSTEEAEQALVDFRQRAQASGQAAAKGFDDGAKAAGGGAKTLIASLQEYRREQTQSSRAARFFANEVVSFVPGLNTAGAGVRGLASLLIEGAAGGLGFGLALEGVKLAVGLATEAMEAQAQELEKIRTLRIAVAVAYGEASDRILAATRQETEAAKIYREEMEKHRPVLKQVGDALGEARAKGGPSFTDYLRGAFQATGGTVENAWKIYQGRISLLEKEYDRADASARKFAATQASIATDATPPGVEKRLAGQDRMADHASAAAETQIMAKRRELAREAALIGMDERQKLAQQLAYQIEDLRGFGASDAETRRAINDARKISAEKGRQALMAEWAKEQDAAATVRKQGSDAALEEAKASMERLKAARALAAGLDPNDQTKMREEMALLDEVAAKYRDVAGVVEMVEAAKSQIVRREAQRRIAAWKEESAAGLAGATALQMTADMIGGQFAKMAMHAGAYDRAMQAAGKSQAMTASEMEGAALKWTQEVLAAIAQQAAVKAIFYLAEGYALASNPYTAAYAPVAFQAAATFGVVSGAAAAAGYAIGEMRPMTQQERQQVEGAQGSGSGSSSSGSSGSSWSQASGTSVGWRDAGVDMSDRRPVQVVNNYNTIQAIDVQSFEQAYRKSATGVLRVQREWRRAGRDS